MRARDRWTGLCFALMATGSLFLGMPVRAATVTFSAALDLSAPGVFNPYGAAAQNTLNGWSSISSPVNIGVGDSFSLTYTFLAGQALHVATLGYVTISVADWNPATSTTADGAPYSNFTATGTVSLLGADGSPIYSFSPAVTSNCCVRVGGTQIAALTDLTFYGIKYDGVLDQIDETRQYNLPGLGFLATGFAIVAPPVPELSTWSMMLLGFAGLGFMLNRRHTAAA